MAVTGGVASNKPQSGRLHYLDNLKAIVIILVIFHHAGQPYGPGGWWFVQGSHGSPLLGMYFWLQASFFMGLMFLVSAYFIPRSLDRKGTVAFLKDRFRRLGIPLVLFFLTVMPLQTYLYYTKFRGGSLSFLAYYVQIYFGFGAKPAGWSGPTWPDMQFGHLWFIEHLLAYTVLYALLRFLVPSAAAAKTRRTGTLPNDWYLVGYVLALSAVSLLVRVWYPLDKWVAVLGFIQTEPAHLPQYLSMFFLGIAAYRRNWLGEIPLTRGLYWLAIGLAAFVVGRVLPLRVWCGDAPAGVIRTFAEGFVAVGISVGLVAIFKSALNRSGGIWQFLSANAYASYIFHVPVVIALQYALLPLAADPLVKFAIVGLIGVPATFGLSHLIRKLPLAGSIL